jgi:UDP-2-acetamido-2-deoxy-ribo-hexuluronate aminotransferase
VFVEHRAGVQAALQAQGIPTAVHYPLPLHFQPAYAQYCGPDSCPRSAFVAQQVMSLPMSADLGEADQGRVTSALLAQVGARDRQAHASPDCSNLVLPASEPGRCS